MMNFNNTHSAKTVPLIDAHQSLTDEIYNFFFKTIEFPNIWFSLNTFWLEVEGQICFAGSSEAIKFSTKLSNSKKGKRKESQRLTTKEEIEKFNEILAGSSNNYTTSLKKLVLKILSNNEIFDHIKNTFDEELNDHEFK